MSVSVSASVSVSLSVSLSVLQALSAADSIPMRFCFLEPLGRNGHATTAACPLMPTLSCAQLLPLVPQQARQGRVLAVLCVSWRGGLTL